jgi:hypothetical protein
MKNMIMYCREKYTRRESIDYAAAEIESKSPKVKLNFFTCCSFLSICVVSSKCDSCR